MKVFIKKLLREELDIDKCNGVIITPEIANEVRKFNSDDDLLRAGGISNEALDRAAFGFTEEDIKTLNPKQLNVKWDADLENVEFQVNQFAMKHKVSLDKAKLLWAKKVNLNEPIDVIYEKDKFYIDDGHHRYYAAKILGKSLNVNLEIHQNPIEKLSNGLGYDEYHKCVFGRVKNQTSRNE